MVIGWAISTFRRGMSVCALTLAMAAAAFAASEDRAATPDTNAPATPLRKLVLLSTCDDPLRVLLTFYDPASGWRTEGWWRIAPKDRFTPVVGGAAIALPDNAELYLHARTPDYHVVWPDHTTLAGRFQGEDYTLYAVPRFVRGPSVEVWLSC